MDRDDCGHLKTCGDCRLGQGEVEYACQLFCACSENTPWNTVRSRSLVSVDVIKDPSCVGLVE
jgi:hypothetical protein